MKKLLILNALIWAATILIAAYLFRGAENYKYLLGILVVGFTLQNSITVKYLKAANKEKNKGCN